MVLFGDHRDQPGHPDAVGAHGEPHRFAVLGEHVGGEGIGVFAAELEDVADLDAARAASGPAPSGDGSPSRTSAASMVPSGVKSRPGDQPHDMLAGHVGSGDPRVPSTTRGSTRYRTPLCRTLRTDIALDQERVPGEVLSVSSTYSAGSSAAPRRFSSTSRSPGTPTASSSHSCARLSHLHQHVLERVRGGDLAIERGVGPVDQGGDGRRVPGVVHHRRGRVPERQRLRYRGDHGFDVGGVAGFQAAHEGVLADLAFGQELLRRAAAHRARHRRDDDVVDGQAREDPLVGLAVGVIGVLQPALRRCRTSTSPSSGTRGRAGCPARGRASSRYLVWIWNRISGKSL